MTASSPIAARRRPFHGLLFLVLIAACALDGCGKKSADPTSPEQRLLDQAITAMFGKRGASYVKTAHTKSSVKQQDSIFDLETFMKRSGHYRSDRHWFGIKEAQVVDGAEAWASIDATVIPMTPEEEAGLRLESWLYDVSTLEPLKDAARFDVQATTTVDAEKRTFDRLRVRAKEQPRIKFVSDIHPVTHLVCRFEIKNDGNDETRAIVMSDYRTIDGIQVAHKIVSERNQKPLATETVREVKLNETMEDTLFRRPVDLNRDRIFVKEQSLAGLMATLQFEGAPEDFADHTDELKEWIAENGLEGAGPLVVIREIIPAAETRPAHDRMSVAIPVSTPPATFKAKERPGCSLRTLPPKKALAMTCVGDVDGALCLEQVKKRAETDKLTPVGTILEIHFSVDKKTRQLQLAIE